MESVLERTCTMKRLASSHRLSETHKESEKPGEKKPTDLEGEAKWSEVVEKGKPKKKGKAKAKKAKPEPPRPLCQPGDVPSYTCKSEGFPVRTAPLTARWGVTYQIPGTKSLKSKNIATDQGTRSVWIML